MAVNRSFNPQETFQLISDVDQKLVSRKGLFADDEHEAAEADEGDVRLR